MEVKQEGDFKMKSKPRTPKKLNKPNEVAEVKISNTAKESQGIVIPEVTEVVIKKENTNAVQEQSTNASNVVIGQPENTASSQKVVEEIQESNQNGSPEENGVLQEITNESIQEQVIDLNVNLNEAVQNATEQNTTLPENIQKVVNFMNETGGTLEDYVRLNADYSNVNEEALLREYYKKTKPHLDNEDINIILEDFSYDEELDDDRDIRKTKIALKEEVAKAKKFLEQTKSKYYDEIKLRPGVTQEQQKAIEFFNRYNENQAAAEKRHGDFLNRTKQMFNNDFKGFDFNVGEKKFRYSVKNPSEVAEVQSDISNFIGKFLDKDGNVSDHVGYHKALYAARNADTMAQHFYEQGKADAIKEVAAKSKNITTEPRQTSAGNVFVNGLQVKAISGLDSSKLKIKTKKFN
jgi:hypothetical protein